MRTLRLAVAKIAEHRVVSQRIAAEANPILRLKLNRLEAYLERKYQVFVSSTFKDLMPERQAVNRSILNMNHIPSGMEMFPATDSDQLSYITKIIDICDYYVLIIGGRYGSLSENGLSYTEREYNYALERKIPVIAFVHEDAGEIKSKNVDSDLEQIGRLKKFRDRVMQGRICKHWNSIADLESAVVIALTSAFRDVPRTGWRRDNDQLSNEALKKINSLNQDVAYSRNHYLAASKKAEDYENLTETNIEIRFSSNAGLAKYDATGEEIIREFAPNLRRGLSAKKIKEGLEAMLGHRLDDNIADIQVADSSVDSVQLFF